VDNFQLFCFIVFVWDDGRFLVPEPEYSVKGHALTNRYDAMLFS